MRKQILDFVERQSTVDELCRPAGWHVVSYFGLGKQDRDLRGVPCQAGIVKPCPRDIAVRETLSFASGPSYANDNHLLIAHTLRCLKAENSDIVEV